MRRLLPGRGVGAEAALMFYAGHGIQVNGENYLLPVDTRLTSERALRFEAMMVASPTSWVP